jgi:hypothetical protein
VSKLCAIQATSKASQGNRGQTLTPLELIHSDICEMNGVLTEGGQRYFMTMIDDASRYCYVYLLKTKDNVLNCLKTYKAEVENQLEKNIKCFRFDRGGEYFSNEFDLFCVKHDIIESASRPLVGFGVLNDNFIKCLISFVEVYEQILSNRYKGIHGYITRSTIMMQMEICDQCV